MAAYNEEMVIARKIESVFSTKYPSEKIEFIIGTDGCTDRTAEIVKQLQIKFPNVILKEFEKRSGKVSVINQLVLKASHPILFLTDANVFFTEDTFFMNLRHYKNPDIGLVSSNILNPHNEQGIAFQERSYIARENTIKYDEGICWGTLIAPFGGAFSLRRELYSAVPVNSLVDDFYISMKVLETGKKAILEPASICFEDVSSEMDQEYRRKVRISAGNFQNLGRFAHLLWPPHTPLAFCFFSHKVLRWVTPFLFILILISLAILAFSSNFYSLLLLLLLLSLLVLPFDLLFRQLGFEFKALKFITYFYSMNLALLKGFFTYLSGIKTGIWEPTKRNI